MPTFVWEGRTRGGEVKKGTMDADNEAGVLARLKAEQINPTKVKKQAAQKGMGGKVSSADLVIFTGDTAPQVVPLVAASEVSEAGIFGRIWLGFKQLLGMA